MLGRWSQIDGDEVARGARRGPGDAGSARRASPLAQGGVGGRNALGMGARRSWRAAAASATTGCFRRRGAGACRRRCKIFGPLRRRRRIKRGPISGRLAAGARRASLCAPVVVGGRGDADWGRSCRRPIRAATTAARAPRGALLPWRRGKSGAATPSALGRTAPGGRRRRPQRRGASAGAALGRVGAVARFSVLCGGAAGSSAAQSAAFLLPARDARLCLPPSSSAGAVTPTGGGLAVVRFALRRRRRGLRKARFSPVVGESRAPQRPRRWDAPLLAGGDGGRNDGVLPPARRWGVSAPLQDFRSSAAAPPDRGCFSGRAYCPRGAERRPCLLLPCAGDVCGRRRGFSCRQFGMPLAGNVARRHGLPAEATGTLVAAPSLTVLLFPCLARRCAMYSHFRAARTPQSQMEEM